MSLTIIFAKRQASDEAVFDTKGYILLGYTTLAYSQSYLHETTHLGSAEHYPFLL